jgi:hypothetical protein
VMIIRCTETGEIRRHLWKVVYSTQKLVADIYGSEYCVSIDKVCKREQALILPERHVAYF